MNYLNKFKDWLDMYPPKYAEIGEWGRIAKENKVKYPVRYWIKNTLIPNTIWPVTRRYKDIVSYIRFGYFEKMHLINTGLKPNYYDKDTLLLHANFSLLKDFVEIEKAWMEAILNKDYKRPWWKLNSRFRNREYGIEYLDWEITLDNGTDEGNKPQAEAARVVKELYLWWVDLRPARMDPYELLPDSFPDKEDFFDFSKPLSDKKKEIYKKIDALEKRYQEEDTEMLIKLINIRQNLWT